MRYSSPMGSYSSVFTTITNRMSARTSNSGNKLQITNLLSASSRVDGFCLFNNTTYYYRIGVATEEGGSFIGFPFPITTPSE
jgi:hypothetical protein